MVPVLAPDGTTVWIAVGERIVKSAALRLEKNAIALVRSVPKIVTTAPTLPNAGRVP